jgi:hypothetical protein
MIDLLKTRDERRVPLLGMESILLSQYAFYNSKQCRTQSGQRRVPLLGMESILLSQYALHNSKQCRS